MQTPVTSIMTMRKGITALTAIIAAIDDVEIWQRALLSSVESRDTAQLIAGASKSAGHLPPEVHDLVFEIGAHNT